MKYGIKKLKHMTRKELVHEYLSSLNCIEGNIWAAKQHIKNIKSGELNENKYILAKDYRYIKTAITILKEGINKNCSLFLEALELLYKRQNRRK